MGPIVKFARSAIGAVISAISSRKIERDFIMFNRDRFCTLCGAPLEPIERTAQDGFDARTGQPKILRQNVKACTNQQCPRYVQDRTYQFPPFSD